MLFIEYPKCTTCQRAKKWLDERNFEYEDRHIKEQNPTYEELKAQLDRHPELQNDIDFLSKYSSYTNNVDFAGRMVYNDKGEEIINFGKHKGRLVEEVLKTDLGY